MTTIENQKNTYQRLEFLGDRVLNLIVSIYLYKKFPEYSEGELTNKLKFTSNDNLEEIFENLLGDLKKEILEFKSIYRPNELTSNADAIEAYIGSYYLEHKFEATINHFEKIFSDHIDRFDPDTDYISKLQILTQKSYKIPNYKQIGKDEIDQYNNHTFNFQVLIDGVAKGSGSGRSHSKAKQKAALDALNKIDPKK